MTRRYRRGEDSRSSTYIVEYQKNLDDAKKNYKIRDVFSSEEAKQKLVEILGFEPAWVLATKI